MGEIRETFRHRAVAKEPGLGPFARNQDARVVVELIYAYRCGLSRVRGPQLPCYRETMLMRSLDDRAQHFWADSLDDVEGIEPPAAREVASERAGVRRCRGDN